MFCVPDSRDPGFCIPKVLYFILKIVPTAISPTGKSLINPEYDRTVFREGSIACAQYDIPDYTAVCDKLLCCVKRCFGRVGRPSTGETCDVGPRAFDLIGSGTPIAEGNFRCSFKHRGLKPPKNPPNQRG